MCDRNKSFKKIKPYFLIAVFIIAILGLLNFYSGQTGRLLVATEKVNNDPNFSKAVIYVFNNNVWGAQGLVLNRHLDESEKTELNKNENIPLNSTLFKGGPIAFPQLKAVILNKPTTASYWKTQPIYAIDYKTFKQDNYKNVINTNENPNIYIGYAGWSMGQLEIEIGNGIWQVISCKKINLTNLPIKELWQRLSSNDNKIICK